MPFLFSYFIHCKCNGIITINIIANTHLAQNQLRTTQKHVQQKCLKQQQKITHQSRMQKNVCKIFWAKIWCKWSNNGEHDFPHEVQPPIIHLMLISSRNIWISRFTIYNLISIWKLSKICQYQMMCNKIAWVNHFKLHLFSPQLQSINSSFIFIKWMCQATSNIQC